MRGIYICLLFAIVATIVATATADSNGKLEKFRLKDIYDKDGIAKGQRRYIGKRLNGNKEFNAALNRYINHKQDMLEQLRPIPVGSLITSQSPTTNLSPTGPPTTPPTSPSTTSPLTSPSSSSSNLDDLNNDQDDSDQFIYANTPISNMLPQIIRQLELQRQRPAGGNTQRINNNGKQHRRRNKKNKNKKGKKRPQVINIRPNRG